MIRRSAVRIPLRARFFPWRFFIVGSDSIKLLLILMHFYTYLGFKIVFLLCKYFVGHWNSFKKSFALTITIYLLNLFLFIFLLGRWLVKSIERRWIFFHGKQSLRWLFHLLIHTKLRPSNWSRLTNRLILWSNQLFWNPNSNDDDESVWDGKLPKLNP